MMTLEFSVLEGHFVDLRPLHPDDAEITLGWRTGDRARLLNDGAVNVDQQRAWIASRPRSEQNYIIALKDGTPVGMLSLIAINRANRNAEPSRFLIGEEDRVRGVPVAAEAMSLLYKEAYDTLDLVRLYGIVIEDNQRMLKWHKYLGMKEEGRVRQHFFLDGQWRDGIMIGLLEDEYRSVTIPKMNMLIAMGK